MRQPWLTNPRVVISITAGLVCAHALLNSFFPAGGFAISYLCWSSWSLLAAVGCLWRAFHCPLSIRTHWLLAALSLFFIFLAGAVEAPALVFFKALPTVASIGDFFFFSAFVPILLAVSLPAEGVLDRFTFVLDIFQAAACAALAYTVLFGVFPFSSQPAHAMPYAPLEYVYDAEYLAVVLLAALRFSLSSRSNPSDRYFFRYLLLYTSLYAVTSGVYNHVNGRLNLTNGLDAVNDVPSAAMALAAFFAPAAGAFRSRAGGRSAAVGLIDNARPVLLSLALIGLSAAVALRHFAVAFAFVFGAFILYSLRAARLQSKIQHAQAALELSHSRLSEMAHLDSLTGIANRRSFDQIFGMEWTRARRTRQPLSLLLIDVDRFKRINDTFGHQAGDQCLRRTAMVLSAALGRPADLVARYGGDEFAVLLAETDSPGACIVAARIRQSMANPDAATISCPATLSIGVATWDGEDDSDPAQLVNAADRALYAAKHNGRDRVELADVQSPPSADLSASMERIR